MTNLTEGGSETETFENCYCSPTLTTGLRQELVYLPAVNIFLSTTVFLGNALILVTLRKESSLHPPSTLLYRCLATTDLCVGLVIHPLAAAQLMSMVHEYWSLCRYAINGLLTTSYALCSVSLLTLTVISMDRLLALLLRLKYRQVVTLRRTYLVVVIFWVVSGVIDVCRILAHNIAYWYSYIGVPSCLDGLDLSVINFLAEVVTALLVSFNSSLNPFLYCWKISEVRQAVKQTIRQSLCCSWS